MKRARLYTIIEATHPNCQQSYFWIAGYKLAARRLQSGNTVWVCTAQGMRTVKIKSVLQVYGSADFAIKYKLKPTGRFAEK